MSDFDLHQSQTFRLVLTGLAGDLEANPVSLRPGVIS